MEDPEKHQLHHCFHEITQRDSRNHSYHLTYFYVQPKMILNQISYLDCIAFLVFLAPQLLIRVGPIETISCVVKALPFFCMPSDYLMSNIADICI